MDIIKDIEFRSANENFKAAMRHLKSEGKGDVVHHTKIFESDLAKLYNSEAMDISTPRGL